MSVRCVERDLWEICGMLQRGRVEVIEEIKEARRGGDELKAAAHTSVSMIHLFLGW